MLNRRHIIGGAAALPAIVIASCGATPAIASGGSPTFRLLLDRADTARERFNNLPVDLEIADEARHEREMDLLIDTSRAADRAVPMNWQEYTRLIEHMTDDGLSSISDDNATRLLDHARRLAAKEA
jgi:hypothetical protein